MKTMTKSIILLLMTVSICFPQSGTNKTGTTAAQFLKIGVGSRALGLGGAFTTFKGDLNSMYWNPAGIAHIYSREANFNHIDWIADVNYDYASFASGIPEFGTVGIFVSVLSMGDMKVRTIDQPEGTGEFFNYGTLMVGLSYARSLTDNFSIGFNGKYIREKLYNETASALALDIGTLYTIPLFNEFRIGASISNFGPKMKMEGRDLYRIVHVGGGIGNQINTLVELEEFELPLTFRVRIAADFVKTQDQRVTAAIDAVHPNDNTEVVNSGVEYAWNETVFFRAGMKSMFEEGGEQGLTFGFGFNTRLFNAAVLYLDYAYQDFGRLQNAQHISVSIKF